MTALAAILRNGSPDQVQRDIGAMLDIQAAYGADSRPVAVSADGLSAIGLRLAHCLPEDRFDRQPLAAQDPAVAMVADIRLDNRDDLARDLSLGPYDSLADSDILAAAYARWGVQAFDRLRGDFAVIIHDRAADMLILARDFVGNRPLHFICRPDLRAAATMPKGLNVLPEIDRGPDMAAIAAAMARYSMVDDLTFWRDIRRVLPGHYVVLDRNGARQVRYWNPVMGKVRLRDQREYADALRAGITRATDRRLRGETRVGAHLSAGLDSNAVAAVAAGILRSRGGEVVAFTGAPGEGYAETTPGLLTDESGLAARTAALHENMQHVAVRPGTIWIDQRMDRYFDLAEMPMVNPVNMVWLYDILDQARDRGLRVMMSGTLGNLAMTQDGLLHLPAMLARGEYGRFLWLILSMHRSGFRTMARVARGAVAGAGLLSARRGSPTPERLGRMQTEAFGSHSGNVFDTLLRIWSRVDRGPGNKAALAGWGVDVRDPTTDRDLIEFAHSIPPARFWHGGVPRALARTALQGLVAPEVLNEQRRGIQAADWHIQADRHREWIADQIEAIADSGDASGVLDVEKLQDLWRKWPDTAGAPGSNLDWHRPGRVVPFRRALLRGISSGHFIRRASGSNR